MARERWTVADIPDLTGRTAVITGANTGLGLETAKALAGRGAAVVLAVRDPERGKAALDAVTAAHPTAEVSLQQLDLASLASVRAAAAELSARWDQLDLLVNNAGVMLTPQSTTADGFELQFGTNHLGHFALTGLLLDRLLAADGSRIVTVSSMGHRGRSGIDFDDLNFERRRYSRMHAYTQSKLANLLFTYELQRQLAAAGVTTIAVAAHPGSSSTELWRNSPAVLRALSRVIMPAFTQSAAQGALPTLRAAVDPAVQGGEYYGPDGFYEGKGHPVRVRSNDRSHDADAQQRLWAISEELTGVTFPL